MAMNADLREMFACLEQRGGVYLPSRFWQALNEKNIRQLEDSGLGNIKRTLAQNYFTWVVGLLNDQFRFLMRQMAPRDWADVLRGLPPYDPGTGLGRLRFLELSIFSRMLWCYAERFDSRGLLKSIAEPEFGNPFPVHFRGRLISQDLANSVLELCSILEAVPLPPEQALTVCELGAGYGRNAYVFLKAFQKCRYIIVDIPPALYVSQEYLARVLPGRKILRFSCCDDAAALRAGLEQADIAFLLPHQAELLPDRSVDLFVNISSLHEMTREQVGAYFGLIDRLTRGHFYMKQWKRFENRTDGVTISEGDYPYRASWRRVFSRTARAQPAFFEALYSMNGAEG